MSIAKRSQPYLKPHHVHAEIVTREFRSHARPVGSFHIKAFARRSVTEPSDTAQSLAFSEQPSHPSLRVRHLGNREEELRWESPNPTPSIPGGQPIPAISPRPLALGGDSVPNRWGTCVSDTQEPLQSETVTAEAGPARSASRPRRERPPLRRQGSSPISLASPGTMLGSSRCNPRVRMFDRHRDCRVELRASPGRAGPAISRECNDQDRHPSSVGVLYVSLDDP